MASRDAPPAPGPGTFRMPEVSTAPFGPPDHRPDPSQRKAWQSDFADGPGPGALHRGPKRAWWYAATLPLSVAVAIAPLAAVLQSKAMAPLAVLTMLLASIAHRRETGRWPWPRAAAVPALLALSALGALSALWAPDSHWALKASGILAGLAVAGGATAVIVEEEELPARRALVWCLLGGLTVGLAAAALDDASGQSVRAAVRGLSERRPGLEFGLKPAASVMALLLPLLLRLRAGALWQWLLMAAGAAVILVLPGDTAKAAALAGLVGAGLVRLGGRPVACLLALGLAGGLLASPFLVPLALRPDLAQHAPRSALHRMLIWDFALERGAEKPVLGWGMEASRNLPGGRDNPSPASMARLGVVPEGDRAWLLTPGVERMSLHPHNGALQLWLELGWVGLVLGSLFVLLVGWGASPVGMGVLASAAVTFVASFGVWQPWWLATQALAAGLAAGLAARRG